MNELIVSLPEISGSQGMFADVHTIKSSHIVGIQDTAEEPGTFLLKEFINSSLPNRDIHVFCYDCFYDTFAERLGINNSEIHFHDCLPSLSENKGTSDQLEQLISTIKSLSCANKKLVLIVDSISTVLLEKSFQSVYRLLCQLTFNGAPAIPVQMVLVVHEDTLLNSKHVIKQLKHLCRVWIHVQNNTVDVTLRKISGKVKAEIYEYELVKGILKLNKKKKNTSSEAGERQTDNNKPVSTFKLTLSESEKKARDAVQLPYERREDEADVGKGEIFYEPDEFDDWDEEDPDNDLEFS